MRKNDHRRLGLCEEIEGVGRLVIPVQAGDDFGNR
jgi:hypothetical protein